MEIWRILKTNKNPPITFFEHAILEDLAVLIEAVGPLEEGVGAGDPGQAVEASLVEHTLQKHLGLEAHPRLRVRYEYCSV